MDYRRVQSTIEMIKKTYHKILEDPSSQVLDDAKTDIGRSWINYQEKVSATWGYNIPASRPLRFRMSAVGKLQLLVDVYCEIQWKDDDLPDQQDIKIRIWSKHKSMIFRSQLDSAEVEAKIANSKYGRVMSRLHFDRVDHSQGKSNQYHPYYHIQIGGKSEDDELCWHPDSLDIPRIPHYPMELFLVCQVVIANFFPEFYEDIHRKAEWKQELLLYQDLLLEPYFKKSLDILKGKKVLLDELKKPLR